MTQKLTATARLGLAGAALIGLAACSSGHNPSTSAAPPPTATNASVTPTAPVAQATIKDVQSALQQAGYYKNATVDGLWGPRTERAVRRFQHDHNLPANGKLDVPTMHALNLTGAAPSTSANNSQGMNSDASDGNNPNGGTDGTNSGMNSSMSGANGANSGSNTTNTGFGGPGGNQTTNGTGSGVTNGTGSSVSNGNGSGTTVGNGSGPGPMPAAPMTTNPPQNNNNGNSGNAPQPTH